MPQLDKISYLSQVLWILLISICSYIGLIFVMFMNFINIKKIRLNNFSATTLLFLNFSSLVNLTHFYKKNIL